MKNHIYKISLSIFLCFVLSQIQAQDVYKGSVTKVFDLIHTELNLSPDWQNKQLKGTATLTLKPWFYDQNTLTLDAKSFDINSVKINNKEAKFTYNGLKLSIDLGRNYTKSETILAEIEYVAKPDDLAKIEGVKDPQKKGLYFINADGTDKNSPTQLWSEGETSYNSCWFPTLDSPNQKHTQKISLTVKNEFLTLSNGKLINTVLNSNGTRTDTWEQDIPHSVYLTMIAAGPFKKVTDSTYKDFEVSYYVEPEYEKYALGIFGRTPEMIKFFESKLGVKYAWDKYSQIAVKEYISGAMENTTATVHGNTIQKNFNQLIDENSDGVIAHELFHHWFGDLVTCESWANLPLNESFANYSEFLWTEYKYGKDEALIVQLNERNQYLAESLEKQVNVIRYHYDDEEEMFDSFSYAKGGRILHMLRNQVGDEAFFESLHKYLVDNRLGNTELSDLREAFEAVTGEDLNWFFDQWFLNPGHPRLVISSKFENGILKLDVLQKLDSSNTLIYKFPLKIEIGNESGTVQKSLWIEKEKQTFNIEINSKTSYLSPNPELESLAEVQFEQNQNNWISQFEHSASVLSRIQAFEELTKEPDTESELATNPLQNEALRKMALLALNDPSWHIREMAALKFANYDGDEFLTVEKKLQSLIRTDQKPQVRAAAILAMQNFLNPQNDLLFRKALSDTSYQVRGAALEAILINEPPDADSLVFGMKNMDDANIFMATANYLSSKGDPNDFDWFKKRISSFSGMELYQVLGTLGAYIVNTDNDTRLKAIPFLQKIAENESIWVARFSATQTLSLLIGMPEADKALEEIVEKETDPRLLDIYKRFFAK